MATIELTCPQCHQIDSVRKVSAIVSDGTLSGMYTGYGDGIGYSAHGMVVMDEVITIAGSTQTQLSSLLSPPIKPRGYYFDGILIIVLLGVIGLFIAIAGLSNILTSQFNIGTFFLLFGLICFGIAVWVVVRNPNLNKDKEIQIERELVAWEKAIHRWQLLYYCYRCDGVYLPNLNYIVPAQYIMDYLYYE